MSKEKLDAAAAKVEALKDERDQVAVTVTKEDGERRVDAFLETARARSVGTESFVANGAAVGDPLSQVLAAYCLSRPDLREWLVKGQQAFTGDLTDKQKAAKLAKLDEAIAAASKEHLAAAKTVRLAELEAEFNAASAEVEAA
jgi:hypothetical protein